MKTKAVTPAKAGDQVFAGPVDSRLRGNDDLAAGIATWGHRRVYFHSNIMGNLTIRNVDDHVIEQLKAQAKANQRSLEGEIRHLLTQQVNHLGRVAGFRERTRQLLSLTDGTTQTDGIDLLREDRKR